ncbi:hypothetical protein AC579_1666 [Pseudocercospora musae]|uniref:Ketoreductase (KR) domain-containing protein n=1 Tax=Pseudocercospora musae TaxID=113226 RepID=A0A139I9K1_9PEZI|nr:hypothetical protein AC579_1666 [Pseudocercospora musae]
MSDRSPTQSASANRRRTSTIGPTSNRSSAAIIPDRSSSLSVSTDTRSHKLVLITGATGAIGRATAVAFAKAGKYNLALHYATANEATREKLLSAIGDVLPAVIDVALFQSDLSSFEGVRRLHREVVEGFGRGIDILFLNAGITGGKTNPTCLNDIPIGIFEDVWRMNCAGPILLTQLCAPRMEQQGWGRVVFNSSIAAFTGGGVGPHYASSKSAIHGFVHWFGANVAGKGVTVNAVAPALIDDAAMLGEMDEGGKKKMTEKIPVGRLGRPEEVAETVLWLVSTGYMTRKIIPVDGGYHPY